MLNIEITHRFDFRPKPFKVGQTSGTVIELVTFHV